MTRSHVHKRIKWDSGNLDRFCSCGNAVWVGPDDDGEWYYRCEKPASPPSMSDQEDRA